MSLFSKRDSKLVFVLDVNSSSIGGALVLKEEGRIPIVLHSAREAFPLRITSDFARFKKDAISLVDKICEKIIRESGARPKEIHCILGAPFAYAELRFGVLDRPGGFIFTEELAQKLISSEVEAFKKDLNQKDILIDKKITKVSLNGFVVDNPHGKRAKTSRADIFLSVAERAFLDDIEDKVHKTFKVKIQFTSQIFSDFLVVRNIFDVENNFLIVNVGGEVTEVSVMKEDMLVGTGYFPYGENNIVRDLAKLLGKNLYETKSLLSIYEEGHLGKDLKKVLEKNLELVIAKWRKELGKVLMVIVPSRQIPSHVFLETGKGFEEIMKKGIDTRGLREFTTLHEDFNVIIPTTSVLHPFCDFTAAVDRDSGLALKTIFISQI